MGKGWLEVAWAIRRVGDGVGVGQSTKTTHIEARGLYVGRYLPKPVFYSDLPLPCHPPS